jgi:outer membrane protein TolC
MHQLPATLARATGTSGLLAFRTDALPADGPHPSAGVLTLQDAVQSALLNSPELQTALAQVQAALAESRQTRLLPNPVLSFAFRLPEGGGPPAIEAGVAAELLSLLQRPRQAAAADSRARSAAADALRVALDVVLDVQQRLAAVQAADAQAQILQQRLSTVEKVLAVAEARLRAGEAAQLDVLTLTAQRAELETEILEIEAQGRDERLALARLLGHPSADPAWPLAPLPPPVEAGDEAAWLQAGLQHRPEIQIQRWELAALGDEAALARYSFWEGGGGLHAERDGSWSAGPALDLPLPLFDGGQARQALAEARVAEARHRLTHSTRQVVEEVRRAWAALNACRRTVDKVEADVIPLQERRLAQAEAQYRSGLADVTAVLLAEQDAQASRAKQVALQHALRLAAFRLQRAAGGPGQSPTPPARPLTPPSPTPETPQ